MKYIVVMKDKSAFYTDWYSAENNWCDDVECIINVVTDKITFNGYDWESIETKEECQSFCDRLNKAIENI